MKSFISYEKNSDDVYDDEGEVVDTCDYTLITKIFVCPEDRRKGIARKMLLGAIEEIIASGENLIKIAALPFGEDAIGMEDLCNFYESCGFSVENTEGSSVIMSMDI
jgi:GNAT superfamily N-acetyltransferase